MKNQQIEWQVDFFEPCPILAWKLAPGNMPLFGKALGKTPLFWKQLGLVEAKPPKFPKLADGKTAETWLAKSLLPPLGLYPGDSHEACNIYLQFDQ